MNCLIVVDLKGLEKKKKRTSVCKSFCYIFHISIETLKTVDTIVLITEQVIYSMLFWHLHSVSEDYPIKFCDAQLVCFLNLQPVLHCLVTFFSFILLFLCVSVMSLYCDSPSEDIANSFQGSI